MSRLQFKTKRLFENALSQDVDEAAEYKKTNRPSSAVLKSLISPSQQLHSSHQSATRLRNQHICCDREKANRSSVTHRLRAQGDCTKSHGAHRTLLR